MARYFFAMLRDSNHVQPVPNVARALSDAMLHFRSREFWFVTVAASLLSGFAGPFGTNEIMPLGTRLLFWSCILTVAIMLMTFLSFLAHRINQRLGYHWALAAAIAGTVATPLILVTVVTAYELLAHDGPELDVWLTLAEVGIPAIVVNIIVNGYIRFPDDYPDPRRPPATRALNRADPVSMAPLPGDQSLLFEALPPELGHEIVSIRADDHYVEVCTALGQARVLMRLRDAEAALGGLPGLRVHRSWWVNLDHARALEPRTGGGAQLVLDTGATVPVSRAQAEAVARALAERAAKAPTAEHGHRAP